MESGKNDKIIIIVAISLTVLVLGFFVYLKQSKNSTSTTGGNEVVNFSDDAIKSDISFIQDLILKSNIKDYYYNEDYIKYELMDNSLINFYSLNGKYDTNVQELNNLKALSEGIIVVNKENQFYYSFIFGNNCVVKDFNEDKYEVYGSTTPNCHKLLSYLDEVSGFVFSTNEFEKFDGTNYVFSTDSVNLMATFNIIDEKAVNYRWFENGKELENSNSLFYSVNYKTDADYYVEAYDYQGNVFKTNVIHITNK